MVIIAVIAKSLFIDPGTGRIPVGNIIRLNEQWVMDEPGEEMVPYYEYTYVIPKKSSPNLVFSMENSWASLELLLDGQLIYSYEDPYKEMGEHREWVEIPGDASGKTLKLKLFSSSKLAKRIMEKPMYLGEKNAVFLKSLQSGLYALGFFFFTVILAFLVFACKITLRQKIARKNHRELRYLILFILDTGLWILTDSQVLQLFTEKTVILVGLSFLSFLLMVPLLLLFIRELMVYPWKIFEIYIRIGLVNAIVILGLSLLRIVPIYQLLFLQHILILTVIPVMLKIAAIEIKRYDNQEMKKVILGLGILSLCSVFALVLFYENAKINYAYFFSIGFLFFMMCLAWTALSEIFDYLEKNAQMSVYKKMAYVDGMTGMENRTAFEQLLEQERSAEGFSYIMFDSNNLKTINDHYGHKEGDQMLTETADCIKESFERLGRCFRIGGDEFLVVLRNMSEKEMKGSLHQFDRKLEELNQNRTIPIEIAYGYFQCKDASMTLEELFQKADRNMYIRKQEMKENETYSSM